MLCVALFGPRYPGTMAQISVGGTGATVETVKARDGLGIDYEVHIDLHRVAVANSRPSEIRLDDSIDH